MLMLISVLLRASEEPWVCILCAWLFRGLGFRGLGGTPSQRGCEGGGTVMVTGLAFMFQPLGLSYRKIT